MAEQPVEESVKVIQPKIRIESDGTIPGTRLYAGGSDSEIGGVTRVELDIDVKKKASSAVLHVLDIGGSVEATLKALHITKMPPPICDLLVEISAPERHWFRKRSFFQVVRRRNRGVDYAFLELVAQGWTAPTAPLQFMIPEFDS